MKGYIVVRKGNESGMNDLVRSAVELAVRVHAGTYDRYGAPYILHPMRVMGRVEDDGERIVAVLHDVVEDGGVTLADLRGEGFPEDVVADVERLTRRDGEPYDDSIGRAMTSLRAARVKVADLEDNMDLRRIPELDGDAVDRLRRYHRSRLRLLAFLGETCSGGNSVDLPDVLPERRE